MDGWPLHFIHFIDVLEDFIMSTQNLASGVI